MNHKNCMSAMDPERTCDVRETQPVVNTPLQNRVLASLPDDDYRPLAPLLEVVAMPRGLALNYDSRCKEYIYFPTTATVSVLSVLKDGDIWESAVIGNDGLVGIALVTRDPPSGRIAVVQSPGYGYRLKGRLLASQPGCEDALRRLAFRYMHVLTTQMTQTGACSRHHKVEQQICRWLLLRLDRITSDELTVTQGELAHLLGVHRQCVVAAIKNLQASGSITHRRGKIIVTERSRLRLLACECYGVIRQEIDRQFPEKTAVGRSESTFKMPGTRPAIPPPFTDLRGIRI